MITAKSASLITSSTTGKRRQCELVMVLFGSFEIDEHPELKVCTEQCIVPHSPPVRQTLRSPSLSASQEAARTRPEACCWPEISSGNWYNSCFLQKQRPPVQHEKDILHPALH
ncbi:hypothetical protein BpHYR1_036931 [Brachionus plicatilis]|uniref:Uncharacterized protein n=1 Tax=Brachionus plicatilis TaxID=10195 RepID=A0A3M7PIC6_BRAPC|nr:hypothetical protein BpHYR1_036931 [Brachionus plicatilis]